MENEWREIRQARDGAEVASVAHQILRGFSRAARSESLHNGITHVCWLPAALRPSAAAQLTTRPPFFLSLYAEKARIGPKAATGPVKNSREGDPNRS
jgi:hypothetical protein